MRASVLTADGVYLVDLEDSSVLGPAATADFDPAPEPPSPPFLPRLVAASGVGSTVVAVVDTRPPLAVSHDAGRTWRESGRGLPPGYTPGAGMRGMRERAALVGATLTVTSSPEREGCEVRLDIPLEEQEH